MAQAVLPAMPRPPSYAKKNPSEQPILYFALSSKTLPLYTVNEYAETMLAQRISSISGVSRVQVFGAQKYAVRIQVDPDRLAAHQCRHRRSSARCAAEQRQSADRPPARA